LILALKEEFDWNNVVETEVETFGRTMSLNSQVSPSSIQAAQYSTPFCVAAAAINGAECLRPISDDLLEDERVRALAAKVRLKVDPALDVMFPAGVPGRVKVKTDKLTMEKEVLAPKRGGNQPDELGRADGKTKCSVGTETRKCQSHRSEIGANSTARAIGNRLAP
jgi:2-methylcitrate dehydratase PrpD